MKVLFTLALLASAANLPVYASSFDELKEQSDAYYRSGQAAQDEHARAAARRRAGAPEWNRKVLSASRKIANQMGGLVGQFQPTYSEEGSIYRIEFRTREAFHCRSGRILAILTCINERTLEQTEAWINPNLE